jgi:hypothetical protein
MIQYDVKIKQMLNGGIAKKDKLLNDLMLS